MRSSALFSVIACMAMGCGKVDATVDGGPAVVCDPTTHTVAVLPNGSFDSPTPVWVQDPPPLLCGNIIMPFDGTTAGCLGGKDGATDTLSQTIRLPGGATSLTLNGQKCITTKETAAVDSDILSFDVLAGAAPLAALGKLTNQQGVDMCQFTAFTLQTPLTTTAETTATFRIQSTLNNNNTTSFFIDALTLTVGCAP
jgi:hypothetical protein